MSWCWRSSRNGWTTSWSTSVARSNPRRWLFRSWPEQPSKRSPTGLDHDVIVRSMPNTPAQIGEGITVWTAAKAVSDAQKETAREILTAFGDEVFLDEERFLDMATALSGTGPAYVFLFMEAMVDAGVHLGFSRRVAEILVAKTVRGSVDFYSNPDDPLHLARLQKSGDVAGRDLGCGPVLPRKGRFPNRNLSSRSGRPMNARASWASIRAPTGRRSLTRMTSQ